MVTRRDRGKMVLLRRRMSSWTVVLLALAMVASACGGSSDSTTAEEDGGQIGLIFNAASDPNQQAIARGLKSVAEPAGYEVIELDSNSDAAAANDLMNTLVTREVDAIVFITFDPAAMQSGISAANEAGIPVYAIGSGYGEPEGLTGAARQDAGALMTQRMAEDMGGVGSVLAYTFRAGAPCAVAEERLDSVMADYPEIELTKQNVASPNATQFGEDTTSAWLQSHPAGDPVAVWACWDGPNIGAMAANKAAERTDVMLYGGYGQAEAIVAIAAGDYTATWFFDLGSDGERAARDIISGEYSLDNPDFWESETVMVDASTVERRSGDRLLRQGRNQSRYSLPPPLPVCAARAGSCGRFASDEGGQE